MTFEITNFENRCPRFSGCALQFRAVNFQETIGGQVFAEYISNRALKFEDSLVGLCLTSPLSVALTSIRDTTNTEIYNSVIETCFQEDSFVLDLGGITFDLGTISVFHTERKTTFDSRDQVDLCSQSV